MILKWKKSESGVYPQLVDTTSSKYVVYLRKNVAEKQATDEITGETHIMYEYDEAKLTKEQYEEYLKHPEIPTIIEMEEKMNSLKQENADLQSQIELLTGCILEMSEVLYV